MQPQRTQPCWEDLTTFVCDGVFIIMNYYVLAFVLQHIIYHGFVV